MYIVTLLILKYMHLYFLHLNLLVNNTENNNNNNINYIIKYTLYIIYIYIYMGKVPDLARCPTYPRLRISCK